MTFTSTGLEGAAEIRGIGDQIARARRKAGLSQRLMADRMGIALWRLDRLERGLDDPTPHVAAAATITGTRLLPEPSTGAATPSNERQRLADGASISTRTGLGLVLGSVAALVLVRFFSEVVHVVPRAANFIDVPIFVLLGAAALARPGVRHGRNYLTTAPFVVLFLVLCTVSTVLNVSRVAVGPVVVFLYDFLGPVGVYAAVYRLWPPGHARLVTRGLFGLCIFELVVVVLFDLPKFAGSHNPDYISGTFGTNAYQLVFFLIVCAGALGGMYTFEKGSLPARATPFLSIAILATIFLAQYRALIFTSALTLLIVGFLLRSRFRGVIAAMVLLASFVITLSYVSKAFPGLHLTVPFKTSPGVYLSARISSAGDIGQLYSHEPRAVVTGTGPGTFSSRAWQTFATIKSQSASNVAGKYVSSLTGGRVYHTDVSDKYVLPQYQAGQVVQGSKSVTSPFVSYLSLLAEVGVPGLILVLLLYLRATARITGLTVSTLRDAAHGDSLPALLIAATVAFLLLLQMGVLAGNWLEVQKATYTSWALLAIALRELDARLEMRA